MDEMDLKTEKLNLKQNKQKNLTKQVCNRELIVLREVTKSPNPC